MICGGDGPLARRVRVDEPGGGPGGYQTGLETYKRAPETLL